MEHIVHPAETLRDIAGLLKPDGIFYCIVPNVLTNIADFIVVDHVNHFTKSSLAYLLESAGLKPIEIDDTSHRGAFVVIATKPGVESPAPQQVTAQKDITHTMGELNRIATFWKVAGTNTRNFEATLGESEEVAIYGAGFYGAFLSACLDSPGRVACFLDQNPHLQGKLFNGNPILPPADLPDKIHTLLVGLNPAYANQIIADISTLQQRSLRFFYL